MAKERTRARRSLLALGQRVEKFRQQKGWNRTTLATRAGVAVATIRACETGTKVTQPNKLQKIARALGMTSKRLETDDTLDPRVNHWTDEDYEIGNWYHNAPRQVKNWIWSLQESSGATTVLSDDLFLRVLDHWPRLTQQQKAFVLQSVDFITKDKTQLEGGTDALAPAADPKTRGPLR